MCKITNIVFAGGLEMQELKIILIEDKEKDAKEIENIYREAFESIKKRGLLEYFGCQKVTIEWMKGKGKEVQKRNEKYCFYDEKIYEDIKTYIEENSGEEVRIGILLDVSLSEEEFENSAVNDYSNFKIARTIYEKFHEEAHIYVITSIRDFSSQVLNLMGTKELLERYVSKALLIDYPSYGTIARTIKYMYGGEKLEEEREDEIDQLS